MWHIWGLTRSPEIPCEATCRIQALPFPARRTGRHAERHVPQEESGPHVAIIYYMGKELSVPVCNSYVCLTCARPHRSGEGAPYLRRTINL